MLARTLLVEAHEALTKHNQMICIDMQNKERFIHRKESDKYSEILKIEEETRENLKVWEERKHDSIRRNSVFEFTKIWTRAECKLEDEISESRLIEPILTQEFKVSSGAPAIRKVPLETKLTDVWKKVHSSFIKKIEEIISDLSDEFPKETKTLIENLDSEIKCSFYKVITPYLEAVAKEFKASEDVNIPSLKDSNREFELPIDPFKGQVPPLQTCLTLGEKFDLAAGKSILGSFAVGSAAALTAVLKGALTGDFDLENLEHVIEKVKEAAEEEEDSTLEKVMKTGGKGAAVGAPVGAGVGLARGLLEVEKVFEKRGRVEIEGHLNRSLNNAKKTGCRALGDYAQGILNDLEARCKAQLLDLRETWEREVAKVKNSMKSDNAKIREEIRNLEQQSESAVKQITQLDALLAAEAE